MRKFFLILSILSFQAISAQANNEKNQQKAVAENKDSVVVTEAEKVAEENKDHGGVITEESVMDVFANDPTFDYYGLDDTINVNVYNVDLTKKQDTTIIVLQDYHQCDYFHPNAGPITSCFGPRSKTRYHYGVDIDLETGDPVYAAFEGMVRIARTSSTFGNVVVIRHKNGLETLYAHLSELKVEVGQHVEPGDLIGLGGNTGRSFGSHLHFEVRFKGQPINPQKLISFTDNKLLADTLTIDKEAFKYLEEFKTFAEEAQKAKKKVKFHTVKKGETLYRIAKKYNTTVKDLCKLNKIKPSAVLKTGKKIRYS